MCLISPEIEYLIVRFFYLKKMERKNPITWKMSIMILMFNMSLLYRLSYQAYSWQSFHHNKSNRNTIFTRKQTSCPQTTTISISYHYHFLWHMLKETEVGSERWTALYTYNKLYTWRNLSASELFVLVDYMICTQLVIRLWVASAGITPSPSHSMVAPTIEHVLTRRNLLRRQVKDCD